MELDSKDGEFLLLDNPGKVLCKWLVENIDESGRLITEERDFKAMVLFRSSVKMHGALDEMVYSLLSIINQNKSYCIGHGSCLNETCVRLQAEVNALQAENGHLKAQLRCTSKSELAVQHFQAALSALTCLRNLTYTATSQICSGLFTLQKKELAAAKGVTKASAGTAVFNEEKVGALFGNILQMC
ncbi:hypothetical protein NDU88_002258 [Pleurodeles waltl]|uniref:Uncharacterized protein n=1 Tax=Pleurodeles waltl TaxID=8319 RepID=A0AAV7KT16_PLEWA|nr:hypothetical protein NDU88_002258 [Pleurodeles waltl]